MLPGGPNTWLRSGIILSSSERTGIQQGKRIPQGPATRCHGARPWLMVEDGLASVESLSRVAGWKWAILWLQGCGQLGMWCYVMLCGVIVSVCNDHYNCCPLGGHRGLGSSPCSWEPLAHPSSQVLNAGEAGRRSPAGGLQISFLALGPPLEASTLLRRHMCAGTLWHFLLTSLWAF